MSPEILNPESKVGTLNPKTFESGEFRRVNDFFSNPEIFPPAIFSVCGRTKMVDYTIQSWSSRRHIDGYLMAVAG